MEYTKQTWTAPTGTGLSRYAKSGETETHVELALDPVNLTNTPTPFTMARMAYMEEGIAKSYDTAPPTPWAQYSGKDIPQLPDNVAGRTYFQDEWATTDGWGSYQGTLSVTPEGQLKSVATVAGSFTLQRTMSFTGKVLIIKIKGPVGSNGYIKVNIATTKQSFVYNGLWQYFAVYVSEAVTNISLTREGGSPLAIGDVLLLDFIYIGSGAYDRLVFDNSYHYRHLLNNAVVPTPQGLYFNGTTSYLRSKEKITLPDVFTFSATVNCAKTATYQRIFEIYSSPTSLLHVYINQNTNTIILGYYNTASASRKIVYVDNFFVDNTDVDTKIEIDFINRTIKLYKNNVLSFSETVTGIKKPAEEYLYIGSEGITANVLLGYMRNICLFDTTLTDTQRNWLAQGNTPPILYDVTNYETEGYVRIQDADGTNTGGETDVDSNGNRILKLPATIKATLSGNASTASKANVRVSLRHGNTFFAKTWTNLTDFNGERIWTDGDNIYYSDITQQFVLNKTTATWVVKTWTGLTDFIGNFIWTDGENIYHSNGTSQLVLNKTTSTWTAKIWIGLTVIDGAFIWTDGENIYFSSGTTQYVLNKTTPTWTAKIWTGLTNFIGTRIWTDGENIYFSSGTTQYVLNKTTSTWTAKTWTGLTDFNGSEVWTDGENIYYSFETQQFVLNKTTSTWTAKTWTGLTDFIGYNNWTDGENIYYSSATTQRVLPATRHNYVDDAKYNSLFGTVTKCACSTLSDRFVFRNE